MKVKEESENAGLRLNIKKLRSWSLGPITSWQIEGENTEAETDFISWAPKSQFFHCCKSSRAHIRFPKLGIQLRDWEPTGNLTSKTSGILIQNFHRTGEIDSWRAQTKPCAYRTQEKGAVIPQETEPDLLVSIQDSPAEAWVASGLGTNVGSGALNTTDLA